MSLTLFNGVQIQYKYILAKNRHRNTLLNHYQNSPNLETFPTYKLQGKQKISNI